MKLVEELLQLTRYVHRAQEFILLASRRYDKVVCQHALIQMPSLSEQRIWASECNTKENRGFKKDSSLFLIFKVSFLFLYACEGQRWPSGVMAQELCPSCFLRQGLS